MAVEYKYTFAALAEVFTIFAKYNPDEWGDMSAEHDIIYAGVEPSMVSDEDKKRLEELDWLVDERLDTFYTFT